MRFFRHEVTTRLHDRFQRLYGEEADLCLERMMMMLGRYGVGLDPAPPACAWDQTTAVLITYADMVQAPGRAPLTTLKAFCDKHLQGALSHVHVLPFCPYSSDDGFSVIDYRAVHEEYGRWSDMEALGENFGLMFDLVLNHASRKSDWFKQFLAGVLPGRGYFVTADPREDLSAVVRPRTHPLLTRVQTRVGEEWVWTTFSDDQVDLDFSNPDVLFEFLDILFFYIAKGATIIRLDAIAYLWKEIGTDCIHRPETHEVVKLLRDVVEMVAPEVLLLTETNVPHKENVSYFGKGDEAQVVYQFSLPPLLLHALLKNDATHLTRWAQGLDAAPHGCTFLNFTASHDGVGVRPLEGLVPAEEVQWLADRVRARGGGVSCKTNSDGSESPYELNMTYFDALMESDAAPTDAEVDRFLCSQTIALALRGIPAVYFHSLTATRNWHAGVEELGYARAINRMKWSEHDVDLLLKDNSTATHRVFEAYSRILRIRAAHPAFHPDGAQTVLELDPRVFAVERTAPGGGESVLAVHNVSGETLALELGAQLPMATREETVDLLSEETWTGGTLHLAPYQARWLVLAVD